MPTARRNHMPTEETVLFALFVSVVLHNKLEDLHAKYLSSTAMDELDPIIRNAVFSAIHVFLLREQSPGAQKYVNNMLRKVPPYWEAPICDNDIVRLLVEDE